VLKDLAMLPTQEGGKGWKDHGLPIFEEGMRLNNHLFFTEDSLLFGKANVFEWINVPEILQVYMQASGQKLKS
jgi:hypothetical protein